MGFSRTFDFASRVDLTKVNKRVVENLIKSGSMDTFGYRRRQLLAIMDRALDAAAQDQHDRMTGQLSLFGGDTRQSAAAIPIPDLPEIPKDEVLRLEKELIGFYVTGHPLDAFRKVLSSMTGIARCTEEHYHDGERVTVGGLITGVRIRSTKKGSVWRPLCWKI